MSTALILKIETLIPSKIVCNGTEINLRHCLILCTIDEKHVNAITDTRSSYLCHLTSKGFIYLIKKFLHQEFFVFQNIKRK